MVEQDVEALQQGTNQSIPLHFFRFDWPVLLAKSLGPFVGASQMFEAVNISSLRML